ncbi:MAG: tetratricopeptide repeat protein [Chloroflexota bacterium]
MLPLTSFIGREKEFADIQRLLAQPDCQLLTLVGPGGTGKTRLALQLEAMFAKRLKHGTAVISLEPLRSAEFFIPTITDTLHYNLSGPEPPLQQLGRFLGDKEMLIVLDNFEHILDAAEQLMMLLPLTPQVKYLVTSREALNLQEEWLYPTAGLAFPPESALAQAQTYDAIQLFDERAKRVYPDFSLDAELDSVVKICQLVDGMPLALELAAAWRRTLRCQAIATEIQRDLEFLSTRLRNVPARHRSIQAIFDQTWNQLRPAEQAAFKRLSVFRGGFQRGAAAAVALASPRILSALVETCLLRVTENGRYHLHALLRQYAAEQLESDRDDVVETQAAHAAYYINYLQTRLANTTGHHQLEAITEIHDELDNIRVAWLWAVGQADAKALRNGGATLGMYYQLSGNYVEGLRLFSEAVQTLQAQEPHAEVDEALLTLLICQSWYNLRLGRPDETERGMRECEAIYQRLGVPYRADFTSDPVGFFSILAMFRGDFAAAEQLAEQSLQRAEAEQNGFNLQFAYKLLSDVYLSQGQIERAQHFAQQAYAMVQTNTGDEWFLAYILNNLGQIGLMLGDTATAKAHFQTSYQIRHAFDDPEMGVASIKLANIALQESAFAEAEARFEESRKLYQKINDKGGVAETTHGLGIVALAQAHYEAAQTYFREALQLGVEINHLTFLPALLVDIAELFWQVGRRKRPLTLLTFVTQHPSTDHETQTKAEQQLNLYKLAVAPSLYAEATQLDTTDNLKSFCTTLLIELAQPMTIMKPEKTKAAARQPLFDPLTARELEVLGLMANGRSNPEIAAQLIISVGTVKAYTNKIFSKLGVRNRVEAVTRARELAIL